jgi:hypothetical protein
MARNRKAPTRAKSTTARKPAISRPAPQPPAHVHNAEPSRATPAASPEMFTDHNVPWHPVLAPGERGAEPLPDLPRPMLSSSEVGREDSWAHVRAILACPDPDVAIDTMDASITYARDERARWARTLADHHGPIATEERARWRVLSVEIDRASAHMDGLIRASEPPRWPGQSPRTLAALEGLWALARALSDATETIDDTGPDRASIGAVSDYLEGAISALVYYGAIRRAGFVRPLRFEIVEGENLGPFGARLTAERERPAEGPIPNVEPPPPTTPSRA